jgi:hypothetical protein
VLHAALEHINELAERGEDDTTATYRAYGFMAFAMAGYEVVGITGFPDRPGLFERLGLRDELAG